MTWYTTGSDTCFLILFSPYFFSVLVQIAHCILTCLSHIPIIHPFTFFLNTSYACEYTQTPQRQGFFLPAKTDSHTNLYAPHHMPILLALFSSFPDMLDSVSGLCGIVKAAKYLI